MYKNAQKQSTLMKKLRTFLLGTLTLTIEGTFGSSIQAEGNSINQNITLSRGSQYKGTSLNSENATLNATSGSRANLVATKTITGELSVGSRLDYRGNPQVNVLRDISSTIKAY
jgi:hypothetical protein